MGNLKRKINTFKKKIEDQKPLNLAQRELATNPLFRPKACKSKAEQVIQRDKWDRNAKHKGRVHADPFSLVPNFF